MKRTDKPRSIAIQLRALKVSYTGLEHSYVQETLERLAEEVDELAKGREEVCVVKWGTHNIRVFETQEETEGLMHKLWLNHEDKVTNNMVPIQKGDSSEVEDDNVD